VREREKWVGDGGRKMGEGMGRQGGKVRRVKEEVRKGRGMKG